MSAYILSESSASVEESVDNKEELEAFNKLLVLEKDLTKLKSIVDEVKKLKKCCSVSSELEEINASRKK